MSGSPERSKAVHAEMKKKAQKETSAEMKSEQEAPGVENPTTSVVNTKHKTSRRSRRGGRGRYKPTNGGEAETSNEEKTGQSSNEDGNGTKSSKSKHRRRVRQKHRHPNATMNSFSSEDNRAKESLSADAIALLERIQNGHAVKDDQPRLRRLSMSEFWSQASGVRPRVKAVLDMLGGTVQPDLLIPASIAAKARPPVPGFPSPGYAVGPELFKSTMEAIAPDLVIRRTRYTGGVGSARNTGDCVSGELLSRVNFSPMYPLPHTFRSAQRPGPSPVNQGHGRNGPVVMPGQTPFQRERATTPVSSNVRSPGFSGTRSNVFGQGDGRRTSVTAAASESMRSVSSPSSSATKRRSFFQPYMKLESVSVGLANGDLVKGAIRVNQKNYEESYIDNPDGDDQLDLLILGMQDRNRALHGDVVIARIKPRQNWVVRDNLHQAWRNGKLNVSHDDDGQPLTIPPTPRVPGADEMQVLIGGLTEITISKKELMKNVESCDCRSYNRDTMLLIGAQLEVARNGHYLDVPPSSSTHCRPSPEVQSTIDSLAIARPSDVPRVVTPPRVSVSGKNSKRTTYKILKDLPSEDWGMPDCCLQKTAEVVHISEERNCRAAMGQLKMMADGNKKWALFSPSDSRMPRMMIPASYVPPAFFDRPHDFSSFIFLARLVSWEEHCQFAEGKLERQLGSVGDVEAETEGLLYANDVDTKEFSHAALESLPISDPSVETWSIPEEELKSRKDFREEIIFTIDPKTARDLDDALHIKRIDTGTWEVGVHIADVSYFLKEETELDKWASRRATSVYMVHKVIPMLPRILCEDLCSLHPGVDRLTFSIIWTMDDEGNIKSEWFGRTVIRSKVKLAYEHAQDFIENPEKEFALHEIPEVCDEVSVPLIKEKVLQLDSIAKKLRKIREGNGALRLDHPKLLFSLDETTGRPNGVSVYQQKDANRLVEEYMLLANMRVAEKIVNDFPQTSLLRRHPHPKQKVLREVLEVCSKIGFPIDGSSSTMISRSLLKFAHDSEAQRAIHQVLSMLLMRPMQLAQYFCSGTTRSRSECAHYALNAPLYTHFTSPIRRYADVIVHRLLAASLGYDKHPSLSIQEMEHQAQHCNDKKLAAKTVSELCDETFFGLFVKEVGRVEERGVVVNVLDSSFDVLVFKFGVIKRVYANKLNLARDPVYIEGCPPKLLLHWKADDGSNRTVEQLIQMTSVVEVIMTPLAEPTKFGAIIKMKSTKETLSLTDLMNEEAREK